MKKKEIIYKIDCLQLEMAELKGELRKKRVINESLISLWGHFSQPAIDLIDLSETYNSS